MVAWSIDFFVKVQYEIEHNYVKMSSYFEFYLFTDHLNLDKHNVTLTSIPNIFSNKFTWDSLFTKKA
jgi:hypothetical protein